MLPASLSSSAVVSAYIYVPPTSIIGLLYHNAGHLESSSKLQREVNHSSTSFSLHLYVTLQFVLPDLFAASRFEVYHKHVTHSSSTASGAASDAHQRTEGEWSWLGTAFAPEYRVCELAVLPEADAVHFLIQPADVMGKLVPMSDAGIIAVDRP